MDAAVGRHRAMLVMVAVLALAVLAGAVMLWPRGEAKRPAVAGQEDPTRLVSATLTQVQQVPCKEADPGLPGSTCIKVEAQLVDGKVVSFDTTDPTGASFRAGQQVRVSVLEQEGQPTFYNIRDLERTRPILVLVALFALAVVAFGRWQGVRSLIALAISFAVIIGFVIPAILHGRSPVPVALVGAMAIMLVSLYLGHGIGRKTTAAVVGTGLALVLTAALTVGFVAATSLTGLASEDALNASFQVGGISLRGLLLAGIILGGLGVLDDVTMSQASLVFELRRADPAASFGKLVAGALTVGRDHIAATVNTLFLAYAGASLPLLVLFTTGGDSLGTVATAEAAAVEIVRTLCGSIGLIAAVPLTTILAAALASQGAENGQSVTAERRPAGRVSYGLRGRRGPERDQLVFETVLRLHAPRLSHSAVGVNSASLPPEELPADVSQAAGTLRRLAATASRGNGSRYRRALAAGIAHLDLQDRDQFNLLRCYGPFSTDLRVWVQDDPVPVVQATENL
ncbi:MAG: YibE/F family protein, partial [Actinomycetota bacterium]|nr:YibE/F family protein [Actinomycetota bacterium]